MKCMMWVFLGKFCFEILKPIYNNSTIHIVFFVHNIYTFLFCVTFAYLNKPKSLFLFLLKKIFKEHHIQWEHSSFFFCLTGFKRLRCMCLLETEIVKGGVWSHTVQYFHLSFSLFLFQDNGVWGFDPDHELGIIRIGHGYCCGKFMCFFLLCLTVIVVHPHPVFLKQHCKCGL